MDIDKEPSGQPVDAASGDHGKVGDQPASAASGGMDKDVVARNTHMKLLGEVKGARAKLEAANNELDEMKQRELEKDGKLQEAVDYWKKKALDESEEKKSLKANVAYERVTSKVSAYAQKAGCVNADALLKLVGVDGLDYDDNFYPTEESVEMLLEKAKKEHSYLFSKAAPKIDDGTPSSGSQFGDTGYEAEIKQCKTQAELDAVMQKYGKSFKG